MSQEILDKLGIGDTVSVEKQEQFYKVLELVYEGKNIEGITEISESDISEILKLHAIWEITGKKIDLIPIMIKRKLQLRVSLKRKGKKEIVETLKPAQPMVDKGEGGNSWFQR